MTFSETMLVEVNAKGWVSTAFEMVGEASTPDPMVKAAKALAAAFLRSRVGLFAALCDSIY